MRFWNYKSDEFYNLYSQIFDSNFSIEKKKVVLKALFSGEYSLMRITSISKQCYEEYKKNNFKKVTKFKRANKKFVRHQFVTFNETLKEILERKDTLNGKNKIKIFADLRIFIINLGFSGLAISFGVLLLKFLRFISSSFGDFSKEIIFSLPVFPFILIGSLLIRYILEKTKNTEFISNILQREIGILSTDLLIFTAMASLDIAVVFDNWILILVFTIFGLFWNLICIAYFAFFIFDDYWFEKSLIEFGNSTGVVASGLLLLRLADPKNISKTLPIFTSKQLFAQLILSGGLFTVLAQLMISKIGLDYWTEICALMTFAILFIALIFNKAEMKKFQ